jgi:hypothetical protein
MSNDIVQDCSNATAQLLVELDTIPTSTGQLIGLIQRATLAGARIGIAHARAISKWRDDPELDATGTHPSDADLSA